MTFFVDTNVIVYAATGGPYGDACLRLLDAVASGEADGRTSPAVLEEVWYLERSGRIGAVGGLAARAYAIFSPLLPVTDEAFRLALRVRASGVGPADRVHVGTCLAHGVETIVSADGAFSQVHGLRRVDPLDAPSVAQLLAGGD